MSQGNWYQRWRWKESQRKVLSRSDGEVIVKSIAEASQKIQRSTVSTQISHYRIFYAFSLVLDYVDEDHAQRFSTFSKASFVIMRFITVFGILAASLYRSRCSPESARAFQWRSCSSARRFPSIFFWYISQIALDDSMWSSAAHFSSKGISTLKHHFLMVKSWFSRGREQ